MKALVHSSDRQSEIWHMRMGQIHCMPLSLLWEMVTDFLEFNIEHDNVCK